MWNAHHTTNINQPTIINHPWTLILDRLHLSNFDFTKVMLLHLEGGELANEAQLCLKGNFSQSVAAHCHCAQNSCEISKMPRASVGFHDAAVNRAQVITRAQDNILLQQILVAKWQLDESRAPIALGAQTLSAAPAPQKFSDI